MVSRFGPERSRLPAALVLRLSLGAAALSASTSACFATTFNPAEEAEKSLEQARVYLAEGAVDRAELQLERVLMLMPENAEVRVILASLMAQVGRLDTALLLIQTLIEDPQTADDYRQRLRGIYVLLAQAPRLASLSRLPQRLGSEAPTPSYWRGEFGLGRSTNPLSRTSAAELPLTIADSIISLPLNERPTPGNLLQASVARIGPSSGFDLTTTVVASGIDGSKPAEAARFSIWGPVTDAVYWQAQAQQSLDDQRRYTLGLGLAQARHRLNLLAFSEPTRDETGVLLRYEQRVLPLLGGLWNAHLERGHHAGRTPDYWRAGIAGEYSLKGQRFLILNWGLQADLSGYNSLLENNSRRWLEFRTVALEQHVAITKQKLFVLRGFATERRSNLTIFSFRDIGLQISFVATWL